MTRMKWFPTLLGACSALGLITACAAPDAADARPYEDCAPADGEAPCAGRTTTCLPNPVKEEETLDDGAGICSATCTSTADCPTIAGVRVVCELYSGGRFCTVACVDDEECPRGTHCDDLDRGNGETVRRCTP
jgi:hypothetical protein